ncbi:hypothetical protein KSP39_PZI012571 [Platanthera zijinensis]|uniref:Uncharacterized protein n=1 Tax=Platanthera zijinensis TaxID=2320716 RepID=A0AAP0BFJ9_9ASPA
MMSDHSSYGMDLCSHVDVYSPDGQSWCELKVIGSVRTCAVRSKPTQCWGRSSTACMSGGSLSSTPQITLGGRWRCLTKEFRQTLSDSASSTTSFLLFSLYDNRQYYQTRSYDSTAPPDSEWCWPVMRASCVCLSTVNIKA